MQGQFCPAPNANFKRETKEAVFSGEMDAPHEEKLGNDGLELEQGTNHGRFRSNSEASATSIMEKDDIQEAIPKRSLREG